MTRKLMAGIALALMAGTASARDVVIHAGRLIDGSGGEPRAQVSILIHDDRIAAIQPGYVAPAGAEVVDLSHATVLPGLIDCHVHIMAAWHDGDPIRLAVTTTDYDALIDGVNDAKATLLAGFTSIRDVGDPTSAVIALKKAVAKGEIPGVREALVDSPEQARQTVRRMWREGVDLIKIMPSGGVMSIGDDPKLQLMADDEIKAVIDTAHALGLKVAAHAHGKQAIEHTIALGVDSIEHGSYADAESYKLFKAHGTYLVPTMLVGQKVYQRAKEHPEQLNPSTAAKALVVGPLLAKNLHDAHAAGVKIAFGTDTFGLSRHGENAQEFAIEVAAGLSPMEAIMTATHNAADLIGDLADIGSIQPGRYADIIAVSADPLKDVRALEHVDFVMKGGTVVKAAGKPL